MTVYQIDCYFDIMQYLLQQLQHAEFDVAVEKIFQIHYQGNAQLSTFTDVSISSKFPPLSLPFGWCMQSHYYHLYYPDYPLKMSIGTAVEAVKEGASEPNSTEKVVKEGDILQDVGQEEVKTSTTKQNALEEEKKEDPQLRARKVEAKTNPPEQGTKEVKGLEQVEESETEVTSPTDQEKDILKGDLYLYLWELFVSISALVVRY